MERIIEEMSTVTRELLTLSVYQTLLTLSGAQEMQMFVRLSVQWKLVKSSQSSSSSLSGLLSALF